MSEKQLRAEQTADTREARKAPVEILRPPVDVYEDASGITLHADMPGVPRDHLDIQVDQDTLLIEGEAALDMPENIEVLYADVRTAFYQRRFTLSSELDTERIEASLRDGVLTVHIPKQEIHRPRKIEVRTD